MDQDQMAEYLIAEAKRYFPEAEKITADFHEPTEEWIVQVHIPGTDLLQYLAETDSMYDWFVFKAEDGDGFTIPFPEEKAS